MDLTNKQKELKEIVFAMWKSIAYARDCYRNVRYFNSPETEKESKYFQHDEHLQFFSMILWRTIGN